MDFCIAACLCLLVTTSCVYPLAVTVLPAVDCRSHSMFLSFLFFSPVRLFPFSCEAFFHPPPPHTGFFYKSKTIQKCEQAALEHSNPPVSTMYVRQRKPLSSDGMLPELFDMKTAKQPV